MKKYYPISSTLELIGMASFILLNFAGVLAITKYFVFSSIFEDLLKAFLNEGVLSWKLVALLIAFLLCSTFLLCLVIWMWYEFRKEKIKVEYQDRKIINALCSYANDKKDSGNSIVIRARILK